MQYHHKKSLSLPLKKYPVSSRSHPRRSPRKAPAYLPASPPSYAEGSSQSLPEKRGSLPHLTSIRTKRELPYTLQHHRPPIPYRSRVLRLSPLTKELIHLLQRPTLEPHKFPSLWSTPKRTKRAKKAPTSLPTNKCPLSLGASSPFTSLLQAPLQHPPKQPYGRSSKKPTVGRDDDPQWVAETTYRRSVFPLLKTPSKRRTWRRLRRGIDSDAPAL